MITHLERWTPTLVAMIMIMNLETLEGASNVAYESLTGYFVVACFHFYVYRAIAWTVHKVCVMIGSLDAGWQSEKVL